MVDHKALRRLDCSLSSRKSWSWSACHVSRELVFVPSQGSLPYGLRDPDSLQVALSFGSL